MSIDAILWALKQELPSAKKHLLIELANFADNDSYQCYPYLDQICVACGASRRAVNYNLRYLISADLIARKAGVGRASSQYKLAVEGVRSLLKWLSDDQICSAKSALQSRSSANSAALRLNSDQSKKPVVVQNLQISGAKSAPLYNQSLTSHLKKQSKKELDKNRSDEKSTSDILPIAKSRSKPGQIAVDDARKLLTSSQPSGTLKTSLDERLMQAGHEFKNNEKNEEIEHNSNNGKTHKKNEVENLKPWEM